MAYINVNIDVLDIARDLSSEGVTIAMIFNEMSGIFPEGKPRIRWLNEFDEFLTEGGRAMILALAKAIEAEGGAR